MEELRILYWGKRKQKFPNNFLSYLNFKVTKSTATHIGLWTGEFMYESNSWWRDGKLYTGTRKGKSYDTKPTGYMIIELEKDVRDKVIKFLNDTSSEDGLQPFNIFKISMMGLIYPFRKFWNKLGWVPFQNDIFGQICSVYIDTAFKQAGMDLFEEHYEEYTVPGMYTNKFICYRFKDDTLLDQDYMNSVGEETTVI